jgi:hypothetical protein
MRKTKSLADLTAAQQGFYRTSQSCIGCKYRRGHGDTSWCSNTAVAVNLRPEGANMRGCPNFASGIQSGHTVVSVALAKIAARRRVR